MKRLGSIILTVIVIINSCPLASFAQDRISVAAYTRNISGDRVADELRRHLDQSNAFHVIDSEVIRQLMDYYGKGQDDPIQFSSARDYLSRAQEHYFSMQYEEAFVEAQRAEEILGADPVSLDQKGQLLLDTLLTKAMIARAMKRTDAADNAFKRAIRLNPHVALDKSKYPPSVIKTVDQQREILKQDGTGNLAVKTNPEVAEVFLNGILCGVTPLELNDLPVGEYSVMIKTNRYRPVVRRIKLASGETEKLSVPLEWIDDAEFHSGGKYGQRGGYQEIAEALRVAEIMKADRAVLLTVNESTQGSGMARARLVDRKYRAAFKPIMASYNSQNRAKVLDEFYVEITKTLGRDIADHPDKYLDPNGTADPILLGNQKKKIYSQPVFWGAVGTAVAGALAGGILAATAGGSSSDEGSVRVRFR